MVLLLQVKDTQADAAVLYLCVCTVEQSVAEKKLQVVKMDRELLSAALFGDCFYKGITKIHEGLVFVLRSAKHRVERTMKTCL